MSKPFIIYNPSDKKKMLQYKFQIFLFLLFAIILYYFKQKYVDVEFFKLYSLKGNQNRFEFPDYNAWYENPLTNRLQDRSECDFYHMIYIGDIFYLFNKTPDLSIPVHVFVHGIGNRNDSYAKGQTPMLGTWFYGSTVDRISNLYTNNYRGAFVNVDPEGTIQNNANLLNTQLQRITTYFGVSSVVMVGMSKGGLDIQGAMYYHGAQSMINYVITLGTPHWGSPLASLVCDNAQTLQSMKNFARSDAVKDLRQESVINFRYNFDNNPNMIATPFFTIGATGTCAATSFLIGIEKPFMNYFGENDDFVLLKSTQIPNGFHLGNISGGHCSLSDATYVWQYIDRVRRNPNVSSYNQTDRSYSGTFTQDQYRGACLLFFGMMPLTIVTGISYTYLVPAVNNSLGSAKTPTSNCYDGGNYISTFNTCSMQLNGGSWTCHNGYKYNNAGSCCKYGILCKPAQHSCPGGFIDSGTSCYKNAYTPSKSCPSGYALDSTGMLCYKECPSGYRWNTRSTPTFCLRV